MVNTPIIFQVQLIKMKQIDESCNIKCCVILYKHMKTRAATSSLCPPTFLVLYLQFNDSPSGGKGYICDRSAASKDSFQGLFFFFSFVRGEGKGGRGVALQSWSLPVASTGRHFPPGRRAATGWSRGRRLPSRPGLSPSAQRSGWWRDAPSWAWGG